MDPIEKFLDTYGYFLKFCLLVVAVVSGVMLYGDAIVQVGACYGPAYLIVVGATHFGLIVGFGLYAKKKYLQSQTAKDISQLSLPNPGYTPTNTARTNVLNDAQHHQATNR